MEFQIVHKPVRPLVQFSSVEVSKYLGTTQLPGQWAISSWVSQLSFASWCLRANLELEKAANGCGIHTVVLGGGAAEHVYVPIFLEHPVSLPFEPSSCTLRSRAPVKPTEPLTAPQYLFVLPGWRDRNCVERSKSGAKVVTSVKSKQTQCEVCVWLIGFSSHESNFPKVHGLFGAN